MRQATRRFGDLAILDRIGLVLVGLWILWAATVAALHGQLLSPLSPYVTAPMMLVVGVAVGRQLSGRFTWEWVDDRRPGVVALAVASTFLLWEIVAGGAGGGPLGYANANAALAVQGLALVALSLVSGSRASRRYLALALAGMVATTGVIGSRAGLAVAVPLLVLILLALAVGLRSRWWTVIATVIGAGSVIGAAVGNVWLATTDPWPSWARVAFDSVRRQLWSDAFGLWQQHPVIGAGPGAFEQVNPLAIDSDLETAHSSLLQVAAETGVVGVALFAALVLLGYVMAAQGPARQAVIGVAAWSALAIHSFVDHLLEFTLVTLAVGVVLGWAGRRASEQLDVRQGQGPLSR